MPSLASVLAFARNRNPDTRDTSPRMVANGHLATCPLKAALNGLQYKPLAGSLTDLKDTAARSARLLAHLP